MRGRKMVVVFIVVVMMMTVAMIKMVVRASMMRTVQIRDHRYLFQLQQVDSQNLDSSDHLNIWSFDIISKKNTIIGHSSIFELIQLTISKYKVHFFIISKLSPVSSKFIGIKEAEGWSAIIQSLPKLKILSEEELKTFKYCKSSGIQLNLSKKMRRRGRNTQKLIWIFLFLC